MHEYSAVYHVSAQWTVSVLGDAILARAVSSIMPANQRNGDRVVRMFVDKLPGPPRDRWLVTDIKSRVFRAWIPQVA